MIEAVFFVFIQNSNSQQMDGYRAYAPPKPLQNLSKASPINFGVADAHSLRIIDPFVLKNESLSGNILIMIFCNLKQIFFVLLQLIAIF